MALKDNGAVSGFANGFRVCIQHEWGSKGELNKQAKEANITGKVKEA